MSQFFDSDETLKMLTSTQSGQGSKSVDEAQFKTLASGYLLGKHKNFRLVKELGKGGMGVTWLADELDDDGARKQSVVCKILSQELINDEKAIQNVLEVFDLTKNLNHTNICPLLNRFQDPVFKHVLVMRYADGETLEQWFERQPGHENGLPAQTVLSILQHVASALDAMHLRKIIHRDVKPQNIMFSTRNSSSSEPWLIDFGIAQAVNSSDPEQNRRKSGTPIFMAPEQHYGKPQDARTDQYALAVTAFCLLTGNFPFTAETQEELSARKMFPANTISPVSPSLKSAFLRALAYDPKDRFESCSEFVDALADKPAKEKTLEEMEREIYEKLRDEQRLKDEAARLAREQKEKAEAEKRRKEEEAKRLREEAARRARERFEREQAEKRQKKEKQKETGTDSGAILRRNFILGGLGATAALGVWWVTKAPEPLNDYSPEPLNDYSPEPLNDYSPEPLNDYSPEPLNDYSPEPLNDYSPEPLNDYSPEPLNDYSPEPLNPSECGVLGTYSAGGVAGERKVWQMDGIYYAFRWCPAGTFTMGDSDCYAAEPHSVTLTRGFWMLETEVTQAMWESVMGTTVRQQRDKADPDWSLYGEGAEYPIYYVNWEESRTFCEQLSSKLGVQVSLPTKAQWEYACRAGTTGAYAGDIDAMGWYYSNSGGKTHPVGQKKANEWGLKDMHGNVWEWCLDVYKEDFYARSPSSDPTGPNIGSGRVCRGGGWYDLAGICRSAYRDCYGPGGRDDNLGFRIVLADPASEN